jgi:hypothetical protein
MIAMIAMIAAGRADTADLPASSVESATGAA